MLTVFRVAPEEGDSDSDLNDLESEGNGDGDDDGDDTDVTQSVADSEDLGPANSLRPQRTVTNGDSQQQSAPLAVPQQQQQGQGMSHGAAVAAGRGLQIRTERQRNTLGSPGAGPQGLPASPRPQRTGAPGSAGLGAPPPSS